MMEAAYNMDIISIARALFGPKYSLASGDEGFGASRFRRFRVGLCSVG